LKKRLLVIVFLLLLGGVAVLVYLGQREERRGELYYSGTIEATQAELAFQVSGRVETIFKDEGARVERGDVLVELDRKEFLARRDQALAQLDRSIRSVHQVEALLELEESTLPAEVERAESSVAALEARLDELRAGYRTQEVEEARLALGSARVSMEKARKDKVRFDRLYMQGNVTEAEKDSADLRYETALKTYEQAKERLDLLREGFRKESIAAAEAKVAEGRAVSARAKAQLKKIDVTLRDLEAAQAQVKAAEAQLELAKIQLDRTRLPAPFSGIVVSCNVEPGEVVTPNRDVISLADLSKVELKIFVGETEIGNVKPGQKAEVKIDTFPDKVYEGRVTFISPEAEFTPKIIQTHKERVKLVYLVKISIPNPHLELKPGMPADAWLK